MDQLVARVIVGARCAEFSAALEPFARRVARAGAWNSLAQVVLKLTSPGIPDFYQGTELWDLHLVDPDNRRPVDYARREEVLREIEPWLPSESARPVAERGPVLK